MKFFKLSIAFFKLGLTKFILYMIAADLALIKSKVSAVSQCSDDVHQYDSFCTLVLRIDHSNQMYGKSSIRSKQ